MHITVKGEINLPEVTELCVPLVSRTRFNKEAITIARMQFQMLVSDEEGGWVFPTPVLIASELIRKGFATKRPVDHRDYEI